MTVLNRTDRKETHIDDVLSKFSIYGRYYSVFLFLMFLLCLVNNVTTLNYIFSAETSDYRCKDTHFMNHTCDSPINSSAKCTEWVYDDPHSFMAEFKLACQEWKRTLVGTIHNFGYGVGLLIIGPLSDKIGRKTMTVLTGTLCTILGVARSFSMNYWMFIVLEFLEAAFGDFYSPSYILLMEMVPHDKRVICKMYSGYGSSVSYVFLALCAWLFPYWRHLLRVIYGPTILFLFNIFLLDESPRWLLSKGRKTEAVAVLEKMAKWNKVEIDKTMLSNITYEDKDDKKSSFAEHLKLTFTSGVMLRRFLICWIWWITCSFVHYGLSINVVLLPGNKYINFALFMVVDAINKTLVTLVMLKFRRKMPLIYSFVIGGIFCFGQAFLPRSIAWLSIVLFLGGKMMTSAFFCITYMFTSEIFPTYTRNSMHALCSGLGRVGAIIAPQTPLLAAYWSGAPTFAFGCVALLAGFVTIFAPDTADESLPDNVQQAEGLGSKMELSKNTSETTHTTNTRL